MNPIDVELLPPGPTCADDRQRISRNLEAFDEVYDNHLTPGEVPSDATG